MLTSFRGLTVATFALASFFAMTPIARAQVPAAVPEVDQSPDRPLTVSANVTLTNQYRFRGVDLSGGEVAIQGGFDIGHQSGLYLGTWGSSLDEDTVGFGASEIDVYGGWSGAIGEGINLDVGVVAYLYPDAPPGEYDSFEGYASVGFGLGPGELTVGAAYAPEQASLGGDDNLYLYTDLDFAIPGTPLTLTGHLGYTEGFLTYTTDSSAFDWSIGLEATVLSSLTFSAAYVGAEGDIPAGAYDFVDDAFVVSLSAEF